MVHQPGIERQAPVVPQLVRQPLLRVPDFNHNAQSNLAKCYGKLQALVKNEPRLGFNNPEGAGLKWMRELNSLVFHTPPFHDAFEGRGFPLPGALSFARNINICAGQSAPRLEVDQMESSESKLATLHSAPRAAHAGRALEVVDLQGRIDRVPNCAASRSK